MKLDQKCSLVIQGPDAHEWYGKVSLELEKLFDEIILVKAGFIGKISERRMGKYIFLDVPDEGALQFSSHGCVDINILRWLSQVNAALN